MPEQANFSEVFQLRVDTAAFQAGLEELQRLYQQFLAKLGDQAANVIGGGMFEGIQVELQKTTALITEIAANYDQVAAAVQVSIGKIEAAEEVQDEKRAARAKAQAERQLREQEGAAGPTGNVGAGAARNAAIDAQSIADTVASIQEANDAKRIRAGEQIEAAEVQAYAIEQKRLATLAESVALEQKRAAIEAERVQASRVRPGEQIDAAQSQATAINAKMAADAAAAAEANNARRIRSGEELEAQQVRALEMDAKRTAQLEAQSSVLSTQVQTLVKYYVIYQAIQAVVTVVKDLIMAPINSFREGLKLLEETEVNADKLTGVLAANVKFSDNLVENFKLASGAAGETVLALRDLSIQLKVPYEQLQKVFSALVDAGGAQVVGSIKQMVDLTGMLALAFRAAGREGNAIRSLVSQLPLMIQGSVKSTQAIAEALGMSGEELSKIVASAKIHHDLTEQLQPKLQALIDGSKELQGSYSVLVTSLEEQKKRLEGIAADGVFKEMKGLLETISKYIEHNKTELSEWAHWMGEVASYLIHAVADTAKIVVGVGDIKGAVQGLITAFAAVALYSATMFESVVGTAKILKDIAVLSTSTNPGDKGAAIADITNTVQQLGTMGVRLAQIKKQFDDLNNPLQRFAPNQFGAALNATITDKGGRPDLNKAGKDTVPKDEKLELQQRLEEIKTFYADIDRQVKEGEASLSMSKREGLALTITYAAMEKEQIDRALNNYEDNIRRREKDAVKANELIKAAETERMRLMDSVASRVSAAQKAGDAEAPGVDLVKLKATLAAAKTELAAQSAFESELAKEGLITTLQALDAKNQAEVQSYAISRKAIDDELGKVSSGTARYAELIAQRNALDAKLTNDTKLHAQQRIAAIAAEETAQRRFILALQEVSLKEQEVQLGIKQAVSPFGSVTSDVFTIKRAELALQEKELQTQLAQNQALGMTAQANRTILVQLAQMHQARLQLLKDEIDAIKNDPTKGAGQKQDEIKSKLSEGIQSETLAAFQAYLDGDSKALDEHTKAIQLLTGDLSQLGSVSSTLRGMLEKLTGIDLIGTWKSDISAGAKVADTLGGLGTAVKNVSGVINAVKQGISSGGTLGGIGAGLSQVGGFIPGPFGQAIQGVGAVLGFIGSIFTAAAKKVADDVKKQFQQTVQDYQNGDANLIQTMNAVEQERTNAIAKLSGMKGGKDQLDQILPAIDQEIKQLQIQQKTVFDNFQNALSNLRLHSDTLAQIQTQWQAINKQVTDYIGAGGSAADAAEFLSLQLQNIQATAQQGLNDGEQTAIQDALQLNDLLQQRLDLNNQFNQQQFDLINGDSIEKRQAGAVLKGEQLAALKTAHDAALANIQAEIDLATQKVAKEQAVFKLATDVTALHQLDNELTLAALDLQIKKWTDLKAIVGSVLPNGTGGFTGTGVLNQIGQIQVNVNVSGGIGGGGTSPTDIAGDIADELSRRLSQGQ